MLAKVSQRILQLFGWKAVSEQKTYPKCILIGAPHTSNWDFPLTLLALWALGLKFSWVAKHTLFVGPLGYLLKKIGGIPVDRNVRTGFLKSMVKSFDENDELILAISPEGTRSKTNHWKTGFYNIAVTAGIEICLGYIDYPSKTIGLGPLLRPGGDVEADFLTLREFYKDKTGRFPEKQSSINLRDREAAILQREINRSKTSTSNVTDHPVTK